MHGGHRSSNPVSKASRKQWFSRSRGRLPWSGSLAGSGAVPAVQPQHGVKGCSTDGRGDGEMLLSEGSKNSGYYSTLSLRNGTRIGSVGEHSLISYSAH